MKKVPHKVAMRVSHTIAIEVNLYHVALPLGLEFGIGLEILVRNLYNSMI